MGIYRGYIQEKKVHYIVFCKPAVVSLSLFFPSPPHTISTTASKGYYSTSSECAKLEFPIGRQVCGYIYIGVYIVHFHSESGSFIAPCKLFRWKERCEGVVASASLFRASIWITQRERERGNVRHWRGCESLVESSIGRDERTFHLLLPHIAYRIYIYAARFCICGH